MQEYARASDQEVSIDEATAKFYEGLAILARLPDISANFGWCLAQLAGDSEFEGQFRGMVDFLRVYEEHGLETAVDGIESASGIPVTLAADGIGMHPGYVVGLLDADKNKQGHFTGIACGEVDGSGEKFMVVDLNIHEPNIAVITEIQR